MSIGNCLYCGLYGGHTSACKGVAEQRQRTELTELRDKVAAQRKVLGQAKEALESWERLAPDLALPEYAETITAIQEVLK